nr:MAG TPA: hypothetical protein [Bacteriophage sp.]
MTSCTRVFISSGSLIFLGLPLFLLISSMIVRS